MPKEQEGTEGADVLSVFCTFTVLSTAGIWRCLSCPCSSHPAVGPMPSKMVGKDEGHELLGIFQSLPK